MASNSYSFRGIKDCEAFAQKFEEAGFLEFYRKHQEDLIIGVREGFINLYYNCYRLSKIEERKNAPLCGIINCNHFIQNKNSKGKEITISASELDYHYDLLKSISDAANVFDASKALSKLYIENNQNPLSQWHCIDIIYEKTRINDKGTRNSTNWKFDLVAISKTKPYRTALILLKYGKKAFLNESKLQEQIKNMYSFAHELFDQNQTGFQLIIPEICAIAKSLSHLGALGIPNDYTTISPKDFNLQPEFYIIALADTKDKKGNSIIKQKIESQLVKNHHWDENKNHRLTAPDADYFDIIQNDSNFNLTFLLSKSNLAEFKINNLIDDNEYERIKLT